MKPCVDNTFRFTEDRKTTMSIQIIGFFRLRTNLIGVFMMMISCALALSQSITPIPKPLDPLQKQQVEAAARIAVEEAAKKNLPENREDQWVRIQMNKGVHQKGIRKNGRSVNRYLDGKWVSPDGRVYNYKGKNKGEVEAFLRSQWRKWYAKSEKGKEIEAGG